MDNTAKSIALEALRRKFMEDKSVVIAELIKQKADNKKRIKDLEEAYNSIDERIEKYEVEEFSEDNPTFSSSMTEVCEKSNRLYEY